MADPCPICRGELWVCETHPNVPVSRCCGDCGVPCSCNPNPDEGLPPSYKVNCEKPMSPAKKLLSRILRPR